MNRDDVIRMAREAGSNSIFMEANMVFMERFAAIVAEHEREACARVCDDMKLGGFLHCAAEFAWVIGCHDCGEAIRARTDA